MSIHTTVKCDACKRVFDLLKESDANEWGYGHDCEDRQEVDDPSKVIWIQCDDCEGMPPTTEAYQISKIEIGKTLTPEQFNEVFTPRKIDILCPECYDWRVKEYA